MTTWCSHSAVCSVLLSAHYLTWLDSYRLAHWEEAALRLPAALSTESALRERAERLSEQEQHLQSQVEEHPAGRQYDEHQIAQVSV